MKTVAAILQDFAINYSINNNGTMGHASFHELSKLIRLTADGSKAKTLELTGVTQEQMRKHIEQSMIGEANPNADSITYTQLNMNRGYTGSPFFLAIHFRQPHIVFIDGNTGTVYTVSEPGQSTRAFRAAVTKALDVVNGGKIPMSAIL